MFRRDERHSGVFLPEPHDVTISLSAVSPPILIPPGGGSFDYHVSLSNSETDPVNFFAWIMARLPNGSWTGPLLGPLNLTLPGSGFLTRQRTQTVPGSAPGGGYIYCAYVGPSFAAKWDSSSFGFEKMPSGDGRFAIGEWENSGEAFAVGAHGCAPTRFDTDLPAEFAVGECFPNPFNSETIIPLELPERSEVRIELYNVRGQNLGMIFEGIVNAGWEKVLWNSHNIASGIYLYRVTANGSERGGKFQAVQKMLILK
jgi:hypothetical protein